jgi:hypothetical protein
MLTQMIRRARAAPRITMSCGMRTTSVPMHCRASPTTSATRKPRHSSPSRTINLHPLPNFRSLPQLREVHAVGIDR